MTFYILHSFHIIFDSGASCSVSHDLHNFPLGIVPSPQGKVLGGIANGLPILGTGDLNWIVDTSQSFLTLCHKDLYVPSAGRGLLSPQWLLQHDAFSGSFSLNDCGATLNLTTLPKPLIIPFDPSNNLPTCTMYHASAMNNPALELNLCATNELNQNLSPPQKELL